MKKVFYPLKSSLSDRRYERLVKRVCVCPPHIAHWGLAGEAGLVNQDGGRHGTFSRSSKRQNQKLDPCGVKQVLSVLELLN